METVQGTTMRRTLDSSILSPIWMP